MPLACWFLRPAETNFLDSPEWHGDVLAARKAKIDSGEAQFLTIAQLKERLGR